MAAFFGGIAVVSLWFDPLLPIVATAALVLPFRLLIRAATQFSESDFERFSPILANLSNYRLVLVSLLFMTLPIGYWTLDLPLGWYDIGSLEFVIVAGAVGVLSWSEGLYQRNYYFDRWHPIERIALIVLGALSLLSPAFLLLFLLLFEAIITQFDYPGIGHFNVTHSRLPHTALLITGAFAAVDLFLTVQSHNVVFLLLCGFAAHYFHPGLEKLRNGPLYYLRHNNPIDMFLNAYQIGWLSGLGEENFLRVGKLSERIKPLLNLAVVLIEMGTILVLVSPRLAIVLISLTLFLHGLIFATTGDSFWKWVVVDISVIAGIVLVIENPPVVFGDPQWIALSFLFVVFAPAWMNPASMGWLDVPYVELFRFEADLDDDRENVPVHSNVFRPYDSIMTQGITGTLTFLGENPRITYSHGAIIEEDNKYLHERLRDAVWKDPPDSEEATRLVEECGVEMYDAEKTERMAEFVKRFVEARQSGRSRLLRYLSSPREFYSFGLSDRESYRLVPQFRTVRVYRIDGIWTNKGFRELRREEVLSVDVRPKGTEE